MPEFLRALVYVLMIGTPALFIAQKISVPFIDEDEFRRWRNCWIGASIAVFLSNSFIAFAGLMLLMSIYIHRNAKHPLYFYIILLFVAPCARIDFGIPGIFNKIMELNSARLFSLLILLPIAVSLLASTTMRAKKPHLAFFDICVASYFTLITILSTRHGDMNGVLRLFLQNFSDMILPYFVFSRVIQTAKDANLALLAFAVATMPLAAIGFFEMWKHWRVYYVVVQQWEVMLLTPYLMRDDMLRAATTSIEPIAFGFMCMTGVACLVIMKINSTRSMWYYAGLGILLAGLYSSLSRGPWLGLAIFTVLLSTAYVRKATRLVAAAIPILCGAVYFAPPAIIDRFLNLLPFIGTIDKNNETYRADLFANSMIVIERYPLFGTQNFLEEPEMLAMIQGQGIIDIVNSYLQIALEYGLVALILFLAIFLGLCACLFVKFLMPAKGPALLNYAGLLALVLAMLITIATVSSISVITYICWAFAGICAAALKLNGVKVEAARDAAAVPLKPRAKMRVLTGAP